MCRFFPPDGLMELRSDLRQDTRAGIERENKLFQVCVGSIIIAMRELSTDCRRKRRRCKLLSSQSSYMLRSTARAIEKIIF